MASLTLRQSKGSPLTFAEVDGNFTALNNELAEKALAARTITAGTGLTGGGDLSANRTLSINSTTTASLGLADTSVQPTRQVATGTGLTGGGDLSANRTLSIADGGVTTAKIGDSQVTTAKLDPAGIAPTVTSINSGPLAGFRNAIINGGFDIWQRATSYTGTGQGYRTADRWVVIREGGSGASATFSRQAFTPGQTDVPGNPRYFFRWAETNAGSGYTGKFFFQNIEGADTFAGQQVTFSFYAKAASPVTLPGIFWYRFFDSATEDDFANIAPNVLIGTSWQKYTYTFTLPSVSGGTIGSFSTLSVYPEVPVTGTFTLDFAQFQLEPGPVATPFERRPIGTELALCQRYYEKSYEQSDPPGTIVTDEGIIINSFNTGSFGYAQIKFAVPKRVAPTVVLYSPYSSTPGRIFRLDTNTEPETTPFYESEAGFGLGLPTSGTANNGYWEVQFTASAEL
jgi:hypothetical protein